MKRVSLLQPFLLVSLVCFLSSCQKELSPKQNNDTGADISTGKASQSTKDNTFKGPQVQVGDGKARSWITISHTGVPVEIGIEMTKEALYGLPTGHDAHPEYTLPLHQKATDVTAFDHIGINWNPGGHFPLEVYGVPHFDFHFYTISLDEQMAIPNYTEAPQLFDNIPLPPSVWPQNYVPTDGGEARMGKHWVNILSPELHGAPFTYTMIYGSYNGEFIFVEPMITREYLLSGQSFNMSYPLPGVFSETGTYYPTQYNTYWDSNKQRLYITLTNFVWR